MAHRTLRQGGRRISAPIAFLPVLAALTALGPAAPSARALDARTEAAILSFEDARDPSPELLDFLSAPDAATRGRAAVALGRIGRPDEVAPLAALLQDPDVQVRRDAAFALGEIEDSTASFPLEELLLSGFEKDAEVRELAVYGIGKLGRGAEACLEALHDGEESVQARALLSAWRIPGATPVEEILQFSRHKKDEVRWCAAYCLMRMMGAPPSGRTAVPTGDAVTDAQRDEIATRLLVLTEASDPRVVLQAIRGLRTRPEADVTARMTALLHHDDWRVRVEAVRTLGAALPDTTHRPVDWSALEPLLADPNPNVAATLLEALADIGGSGAKERLYSELTNPAPRLRELALRSLAARERRAEGDGTGEPTRFLQALETLAADPVWFVRAATIDCADLLPEDRRGPFLLELARQEGRVAKLAVVPYLTWRHAQKDGWPLRSAFEPELTEFLTADDPMVALMTLGAFDEAFSRAESAADAATGEATTTEATPDPAATDASAGDAAAAQAKAAALEEFAALLESIRLASLEDPLATDVRQSIVGTAAPRADIPAFETILLHSTSDPNYLVRRDAVAALEAAGKSAPREAGPVETRFTREQLEEILEWSKNDHRVVFETAAGTFEARLFTRDAPLTCWNFAQLANDGFYDDGAWHRVVPDFVLQDGCPRGDGWGGPPHQIRCEVNRHRYERGAMGMALSGKDTGGSQFFFTHSEQPHLDGGYTVFGEIVRNRQVADLVAQGDAIRSIRVVED
ncbi:MAG: HEAT repeat domain-containing protein [Candidatus Eisenbacteria bacterium]